MAPGLPAALRPLGDHPGESALLLDFDGTLSPIVADPATARALPGTPELLGRLADRLSVVAVVSGRPAAFLLEVLGRPPGLHLYGNYGMEEVAADGQVVVAAGAERWREIVATEAAAAEAAAPAGVEVEPKGLSVTLHWRRAPGGEDWCRRFAVLAERAGLVGQPGRLAIELRPPVALDKGTVLRRLADGKRAAAAFGDDVGDLPAFAALAELGRTGMAVARVVVADVETPAEVLAAADLLVDGPVGAAELLRLLAEGAAA